MGCLAEMTVAHSTLGSFGAYAEHYIGPPAGFWVRYAYWSCVALAMGMGQVPARSGLTLRLLTALVPLDYLWFRRLGMRGS